MRLVHGKFGVPAMSMIGCPACTVADRPLTTVVDIAHWALRTSSITARKTQRIPASILTRSQISRLPTTMVGLIKKLENPFAKSSSKQRKLSSPSPRKPDSEILVQSVDVADIDPEKLMKKLGQRFPSGFKVHVRIDPVHTGSKGSLT